MAPLCKGGCQKSLISDWGIVTLYIRTTPSWPPCVKGAVGRTGRLGDCPRCTFVPQTLNGNPSAQCAHWAPPFAQGRLCATPRLAAAFNKGGFAPSLAWPQPLHKGGFPLPANKAPLFQGRLSDHRSACFTAKSMYSQTPTKFRITSLLGILSTRIPYCSR